MEPYHNFQSEPAHVQQSRARKAREAKAAEPHEFHEKEIELIEVMATQTPVLKEAAKIVGVPHQTVTRWMKIPEFQQALYERMAFEKLSAKHVTGYVSEIARASLGDFLTLDEDGHIRLDLGQALAKGKLYPIKDIEFYKSGEVKHISLEPRLEALRLLGAAYGLFPSNRPNDPDAGLPFFERMARMGHDRGAVWEVVMQIAEEMGLPVPKLIDQPVTDVVETVESEYVDYAEPVPPPPVEE